MVARILCSVALVSCWPILVDTPVHGASAVASDAAWSEPAPLHEPGYDERLAALEAELDLLRSEVGWKHVPATKRCRESSEGGSLYAGGGVVFARPHFKESFQYSQINVLSGSQTLHPFEFDYDVTPKVWLGVRAPGGLGVHVDYWQYHHSSDPQVAISDGVNLYSSHATTIIFPATILADDPGEVLSADSSLETQILNLVGTYQTTFQGMKIRAGAGLRYALLKQELGTAVVNGLGVPQGILNWSRRYEGLGPTVMLEARKPIGCCGLSLIAGGGGGLLYGSKTLDRLVVGDVGIPVAAPFLRLDDADEVVGVGELNFGMEWARTLRNRAQVAVQGRYEGQLWAEAGAPTLGFLGFEGFGIFAELRR